MQNNPVNFQDALARAREIASKLTAAAPSSSLKRPNNEEDYSNKRPALSSNGPEEVSSPILRAQQVAQQINSQLGVKAPPNDPLLPISNQQTFQEDYKIPDKFVGLVIGKGGEQIIRLQAESGCKVQICQQRQDPIPGGPNPPDRIANLSGSREAIDRAKKIMDDIISRGKAADGAPSGINPYSLGGSSSKSADLMLPSAKCGLIIGKGGETIRRISEEFSVKMFVVQETKEIDGIEHKPLRIIGDPDRIERVKQYVLDSLSRSGPPAGANRSGPGTSSDSSTNDYGSRTSGSTTNGPCNEAIFPVPYEKAGIVIGKGGESIKEIIRKSGAYVELDRNQRTLADTSKDRMFKIRGTPDQIANAQQLMYEKVANSQGGAGELITPIQFQQKYNLPMVTPTAADPWATAGTDPYSAAGAGATDFYSQWANAYGQWPQMGAYNDASSKTGAESSAAANAAGGMDSAAWLNYYQSMSLYMMQSQMGGAATGSPAAAAPSSDSTEKATASATETSAAQPDYSQQWIEYYRSMGQNDMADQIARQLKESGSNGTTTSTQNGLNPTASMMTSGDAWAAYAQQWAASNASNGQAAATKSPS